MTDFRAGILTGFWMFLALFLKFSELGFRPGFFPGLLWPDFERFSGGTHESLEGTSGLCLGELSESLVIRGSPPPGQGFAIIVRLSSGKDVQGSPAPGVGSFCYDRLDFAARSSPPPINETSIIPEVRDCFWNSFWASSWGYL